MLMSLPSELLVITAQYLGYRTYLALASINKKMCSILMNELSLRLYLHEDKRVHEDGCRLKHTDLIRGLQHMASHIYLVGKDNTAVMLSDHRDIIRHHSYIPSVRSDIFSRCFFDLPHSRTCTYDAIDVIYSEDNRSVIVLHRDGSIEMNGKIYPVQASALLDCFGSGVFYRDQEGQFCVLSYEGVSRVREDIADAANIKSILYTYYLNDFQDEEREEDIQCLYLTHVLYHNGDLYRQSMQGENEERFIPELIAQGVKKAFGRYNKYWILSSIGQLMQVDFSCKVIYIFPLPGVLDVVMYDDANLYVLTTGGLIFRVHNYDTQLFYNTHVACDKLSIFGFGKAEDQTTLLAVHRC